MNRKKQDNLLGLYLRGIILALAVQPVSAEIGIGEGNKLKLYGDMRFRAESDWDSMQSNGTKRDDRDRLRMRLRLGFGYAYDEHFSFGGRLRSGTAQDQQSPHQTLGDEFETKGISIDKAFIHGKWGPGWAWLGKNNFPFWTQNELFWDEDVNPEGGAFGCSFSLGNNSLRFKPTLGYFMMEGSGSNNRFKDKAHLSAGQLALDTSFSFADFASVAGFYEFDDNPQTTDTALADLSYSIWVLGAKASFKRAPRPLTLGLDFIQNVRNYSSALFNGDQKTGYVVSLNFGKLKDKQDWLIGYYYAHIGKYALVARLAQDDWLRWGSTTDTRSSNFKGHEFRLAYALGPSWNIVSRLYLVEGIKPESATAVSNEDGRRFRVDFNIAF